MSYIPKYIMKRLFPKDCVKAVEGGVSIKMLNVISPLSIEDGIPEDAENKIDFILDGTPLNAEDKKKITFKVHGNTYSVKNAKEFEGVVIAVGETIEIFAPVKVNPGEKHEFDVTIQTDNPFHIKIERIVQ